MEAFITGSCAYGRPGPKSDVDLVVFVSKETRDLLESEFANSQGVVRCGQLNLILCHKKERFLVWKRVTEALKQCAAAGYEYPKEVAKAIFKRELVHFPEPEGFKEFDPSGDGKDEDIEF